MKIIKRINMLQALLVLIFGAGMISCDVSENGREAKIAVKNDTMAPAVPDSISRFAWKQPVYDSTKQYIYLTFDDGPGSGTNDCFILCRQTGVKATFFMVGMHVGSRDWQLVNNIKQGYPQFLLANHSYTHANERYIFFYKHPQFAAADFFRAQQSLHVPYPIIRLPGNSAWVRKNEIKAAPLVRPVCVLLDSAGFNVIGWDVEWNFNHVTANPVQSPEKMAEWVNDAFAANHTHVKNHLVILTHDRMFRERNYADSLLKFITLLKRNPRYVFETIDHYPGLKMKPGS